MRIEENIRIGLDGLWSHKLRSVLTALGIIFGVAAVIAMLSIGEGAREEALEQIRLMGMNNILIRAKTSTAQSFSNAKASFSPGLRALDGEALREVCPHIDFVVPQWENTTSALVGSARQDVRVIGTTPEFLPVFGYQLSDGRFFDQTNLLRQDNVCVIGADVKTAFFRYGPAVGREIKIDNLWLTVIGVMSEQAATGKKVGSMEIRNLNMDVYLPITTAQYKMERKNRGDATTQVCCSKLADLEVECILVKLNKQKIKLGKS